MSLNAYRAKAGVSMLLQMLRIPLVIMLVSDIDQLRDYFIVTAGAIPFQFLANEFLLYRKLSWRRPGWSELICVLVGLTGWLLFALSHSLASSMLLLFFAAGLMAHATALLAVRSTKGAATQIGVELVLALIVTLGSAAMAAWAPGPTMSWGLLGLQAATGLLLWGWIRCSTWHKAEPPASVENTPPHNGARIDRSFLYICLLMAATYMERLYVGAVHAPLLGSISMAAAAVHVWRRLALDDAILFESLQRSTAPMDTAEQACRSYQRHAVLPWLGLLAACMLLWLVPDIIAQAGLALPREKLRVVTDALALTTLYLSSLPPAIPALNLIRAKIHQPSWPLMGTLVIAAGSAGLLLILEPHDAWALWAGTLLISANAGLAIVSGDDLPMPRPLSATLTRYLPFFLSCIPCLALLNSH